MRWNDLCRGRKVYSLFLSLTDSPMHPPSQRDWPAGKFPKFSYLR